ncbi:hypothetical protein [Actinokineospora diospyrosa]|uniref:Uncharacterized protein n=1 Tax=Actinokineospora diospyrosa TaxID=103728 RepID=A0ABT1IJU5_9PSEU|nr:hypothetical protein [Actinokineospora diospyrosa]MCP2272927.1 hypothetical protein [Actinokineospora diospyrosa]
MKQRKAVAAKAWTSAAWWLSMNGIVAAFSALIAVAALVVAIIAIPGSPDEREPSDLSRTPDLGLSFWQDDRAATMKDISVDVEGLVSRVRVTLKSAPFEIRFPALEPDDGLYIEAKKDDSSFSIKDGTNTKGEPYDAPFHFGRGHVDTGRGSATLFMSDGGTFNAIGSQRAEEADNKKSSVYYSRLDDPKPTRLTEFPTGVYEPSKESLVPLQDVHEDLYLVVWRDSDFNQVIDGGEYEYITLDFS